MPAQSVLIVEPESTIARLELALLRMGGLDPVIARDADDALTMLESQTFAALVIGWPVRFGEGTLFETIVERLPAMVPLCVLVTARLHDRRALLRAARAGAFAIVAKPFDVDVLSRVVSDCVSCRGSHDGTRWIGLIPPTAAPDGGPAARPGH